MVKLLLVIALIVAVVLVVRTLRSRTSYAGDPSAQRAARLNKLAGDQAGIARQGGQGAGQGGFGGGMGP
jgi:flagellar biogenesis protein FliO